MNVTEGAWLTAIKVRYTGGGTTLRLGVARKGIRSH